MLIRQAVEADVAAIAALISEAAQAYRGVIPIDRWHEPYMPTDELAKEISDGVVFWVAEREGRLSGMTGIQDKEMSPWCATHMSRPPCRGVAWERGSSAMWRASPASPS